MIMPYFTVVPINIILKSVLIRSRKSYIAETALTNLRKRRNAAININAPKEETRTSKIKRYVRSVLSVAVVTVVMLGCTYIIIVVAANSTHEESQKWGKNLLISLAQDVFLSQILKLGITLYLLKIIAKKKRKRIVMKMMKFMIDPLAARALAISFIKPSKESAENPYLDDSKQEGDKGEDSNSSPENAKLRKEYPEVNSPTIISPITTRGFWNSRTNITKSQRVRARLKSEIDIPTQLESSPTSTKLQTRNRLKSEIIVPTHVDSSSRSFKPLARRNRLKSDNIIGTQLDLQELELAAVPSLSNMLESNEAPGPEIRPRGSSIKSVQETQRRNSIEAMLNNFTSATPQIKIGAEKPKVKIIQKRRKTSGSPFLAGLGPIKIGSGEEDGF